MNKIVTLFSSEIELKNHLPETVTFGLDCAHFFEAQKFAESFTLEQYDLMIVDFSKLEFQAQVDWTIQYVRMAQKSKIPILVLANNLTKTQINHFLENGVDDFVYLPTDIHYFSKKIKELVSGNFKVSEELKVRASEIENISLKISFKLKAISEHGFELEASAYLARGTKVKLSSDLIKSIFKVESVDVIVQAYSGDNNGLYTNLCEIDPNNKEQMNMLKMWLNENGPGSSDI